MKRLDELPDDILIQVLSQCDIDTIFAAQLTCATFCQVTRAYIKAIAPRAARNTFPCCEQLLISPKDGYTLEALRDLIPAQLASIILDKDKIRRQPYITSGFPYGIPSESDCEEAKHLRAQVTTGWRVLRSLYLISKGVYMMSNAELKRPNLIRRASSGMRNTRWWQAMSCPYPGCTEHGIKQIFDFEHERTGSTGEKENKECASIEDVRKRESLILQRRLALIEKLPDHVLLDYTHLWRLLLHVFRPYKSHSSTSTDSTHHDPTSDRVEFPKISRMDWCSVINDISQGCSWLNWYILSIGPSPFIQQWSLTSPNPNPHLIRDMIWTTYANRSSHQIEVEREYASRFEFALRKRCLSRDRLKRLDNEVSQGRSIRTISLDCIPWQYDVHYTIARPEEDFPWYTPGEDVWLDEEWCVRITPGGRWDQPGGLWACMVRTSGEQCPIGLWGGNVAQVETEPGPLGRVPYLVYLGDEVVGKITPYRGLLRVVDWNF